MKKTVILGIPRQAISIRKEAPLHMPLPMGIGLNTSTGIASLPNHLRIGLGDSVNIELDTDKPYIHHVEHVKKYPPGQLKNKKKKKHKWG
jgi:hypothetical protein